MLTENAIYTMRVSCLVAYNKTEATNDLHRLYTVKTEQLSLDIRHEQLNSTLKCVLRLLWMRKQIGCSCSHTYPESGEVESLVVLVLLRLRHQRAQMSDQRATPSRKQREQAAQELLLHQRPILFHYNETF